MKFYLPATVALVVALQVSADSDPNTGIGRRIPTAAKCKPAPSNVDPSCWLVPGRKDRNGCPTYTVKCIPQGPPKGLWLNSPTRIARAAKCPELPKADKGCKLTLGAKDASGCPSWTMECNGRK